MAKVISVENLSKSYRLGKIGSGTLTNDLRLWWAKARGKPNPLLRIGQPDNGNRDGETIWALKDVSFTVEQGEVLGIIGRNGAGKSTLLKILSRVTAPTAGEIKVKGRIASLLEVGTGFHPELTGEENIYLNGAILGMSKAEVRRKFDEIIAFAEVEKFIETPVKRYSSGMYVRLAFAVAAHLEPEILLVDEVLAVGDAEFQKKCLGKMGDVAREGRTVLFVSHNMGAVNRLCSKSIWLETGNILQYDETSTIISSYLKNSIRTNHGVSIFNKTDGAKAQIRQIRLLNQEGSICNRFSCDDTVKIEILFHVNYRVRGIYCCLFITNIDGTIIMMSDSHDTQPNPLSDLSIGLHTISIDIPPRTLAHGEYVINLKFTEPGMRTPLAEVDQGCSFSLDDFRTKRGNKRPGYFSLALNWKVDK
jgi:lipopolysaccharide transport system ATP-binding protein